MLKNTRYGKLFTHAESHASPVSLLESAEYQYIKAISNNNNNNDNVISKAANCRKLTKTILRTHLSCSSSVKRFTTWLIHEVFFFSSSSFFFFFFFFTQPSGPFWESHFSSSHGRRNVFQTRVSNTLDYQSITLPVSQFLTYPLYSKQHSQQ